MTARPTPTEPGISKRRIDWASLAPLVTLLAIVVVFGFLATEFFSLGTISQTLKRGAVLAIVSTGLTFVLLCAEIDLSVGTMALLSACVGGVLWAQPFSAEARGAQSTRLTAWREVNSATQRRDAAIQERDEAAQGLSDKRRGELDKIILDATDAITRAQPATAVTAVEVRTNIIVLTIPFLVALFLGVVSGALTVSSGLPSFIITLAMMNIAVGLSRFLTLSQKYDVPQFLKSLGNSPLFRWVIDDKRTLEIPQSAALACVVMIAAPFS